MALEGRMAKVEGSFEQMNKRFEDTNRRMDNMNARRNHIETQITNLRNWMLGILLPMWVIIIFAILLRE